MLDRKVLKSLQNHRHCACNFAAFTSRQFQFVHHGLQQHTLGCDNICSTQRQTSTSTPLSTCSCWYSLLYLTIHRDLMLCYWGVALCLEPYTIQVSCSTDAICNQQAGFKPSAPVSGARTVASECSRWNLQQKSAFQQLCKGLFRA